MGTGGTTGQDEPAATRRGEFTMFAYPWDLQLDGARQSFELVHELGCHRVAVAVATSPWAAASRTLFSRPDPWRGNTPIWRRGWPVRPRTSTCT